MKMRNKGKIYPSPSLSSSSSSSSASVNPPSKDVLSVLKLLPAAILTLASVISLEDREVLAYMITRSLKSTTPSSITEEKKKGNNKKSNAHKPPVFDCDCFDCYTSYWFRWDSSPNRELIHQVIEAFEEHLNNGELSRNGNIKGGKRKEKMSRRYKQKSASSSEVQEVEKEAVLQCLGASSPQGFLGNTVLPPVTDSQVKCDKTLGTVEEDTLKLSEPSSEDEAPASSTVAERGSATTGPKGLVRKVLPDVLGLFNSRLWSLWNPNV